MDQYDKQKRFSNYLKLLSTASYEDPNSRWSGAEHRDSSTNEHLRVLDTIALCMATGTQGDVIASAFSVNSNGQKVILLAKNTDPKDADLDDGLTLIELMQDSPNNSMLEILPLVAKRGAQHVQKRVTKFSKLMGEHQGMLMEDLQDYPEPLVSYFSGEIGPLLNSEFPEIDQEFLLLFTKSSGQEPQSTLKTILRELVRNCIKRRPQFDTTTDSQEKFCHLVNVVTALGSSKFFEHVMNEVSKTGDAGYAKLWRNLDKIRQYVRISDSSLYLKRNGPFTVEWVTKAKLGKAANFEFKKILLENVWTTIESIGSGSNKQKIDFKNAIFHLKDMNSYWKEDMMDPSHATTTLHAELRLIVYLISQRSLQSLHASPSTQNVKAQHPIGCSKRSCLVCTWTMEEINKLTDITYPTAGSHTGVYATSAVIGPIMGIDLSGTCGQSVIQRIFNASQQVARELYKPFVKDSASKKGHKHKNSEDLVSGSDPEGEGEPDKSARKYDFQLHVRRRQMSK